MYIYDEQMTRMYIYDEQMTRMYVYDEQLTRMYVYDYKLSSHWCKGLITQHAIISVTHVHAQQFRCQCEVM